MLKMLKSSLALCIAVIFFSSLCAGQGFGRSCGARTECIAINSCPQMVQLVQSGISENIRRVRQAICGFANRTPLVCCPSDGDGNSSSSSTNPFTIGTPRPGGLLPGIGICGRPRVGDRIIGGDAAPIGAYPWMAAMGYTEPGKRGFAFDCTGSVINSKYVLTAAHCVDQRTLGRKRLAVINLGDWDLQNPGADCTVNRQGTKCGAPSIAVGFESITMHPQYNERGRSSDDIALIRLNVTLDFQTETADVEPVCLPSKNLNVRSLVGTVRPIAAGWGLTEHGNHSNIMLRVDVPITSDDLCKERYAEYFVGDQICVGGDEGFDTCTGDSGGPLVISEPDGPPYTQIGIVSYGPFPCGLDKFPGVYTSVQKYMDWIENNLKP